MKNFRRSFLALLICFSSTLAFSQQFGLSNRVANSTLQLPQNPATYGYSFTNAFPGVSFSSPIAITTPPGETNRLFILERAGRVAVITNLTAPNRTVFMDITNRVTAGCEEGLLGMAFHPGYATNRFFYLFYSTSTNTAAGSGLHQRISSFEVSTNNPNQGLTNSEIPLITQRDEACNHNGGDLHFGPDGYLYISLGDEGNQNDTFTNSQTIDRDFFSGILRIDVDKRDGNLHPKPHPALMNATNYLIPADNPFVGATQLNGTNINTNTLRAEFWAIGLRNPWRMSFDTNGVLYCGDVGGGAREEVNIIIKGGNYGWVWREGTTNGPVGSRQGPPGFSYRTPIAEYNHCGAPCLTNQGNSITGGLVYRGNRISQLTGKYIFSDYSSGNVWVLTPNGTNAAPFTKLTNLNNVVAFGIDPRNGDVLAANSGVQRLIYNTNITSGAALPATLAQTGTFTNLFTLTPHAGIVPYEINVPFWSDNAKKTRWFSIPNTNLDIAFNRTNNWQFPTGTVWVKHFDLELTNGVPASAKRLETRLLVKNTDGVYGATYRWGNSTTNATLVPEEGMDEALAINDGGNMRTQVWHYPSRSECLTCHTPQAGFALGFNTAQLNRDFDYNGVTDNQIRALHHVGYFSSTVSNLNTLRALAHATNSAVSAEYRVRSYLAANCSQCHQPGGTAVGNWDARILNPLSASGIVNGSLANNLGDTNNRVIIPNDLAHSVLFTRISTNGIGRMPPVASTLIDTQSVNLVSEWITNGLASYQTFAQWQVANFGSTNAPLAGATEDFDGDSSVNYQEYLLGTNPTNIGDYWSISAASANGFAQIQFDQIANRGFEVQVTTNLQPTIWNPLDVPANRPLFSSTNFPASVPELIEGNSKFYRVRVFEP